MAEVIVKLKVMPTSPEVDLKKLEEFCRLKFADSKAKFHSVTTEDVAFGLRALVFVIFGDENTLNLDVLEAAIKESPEVSTIEVIDVRRAVG